MQSNMKLNNMKHVRNFEQFKQTRNKLESLTYYQKGKSSDKTIIELYLLSEGQDCQNINFLKENYSLSKIDQRIIDGVFEYLKTGKETSISLLTEELEVLGLKVPSLGDMWSGVKNVVDKGVQIGKTAIKSFGDFIKNIGSIIKGLFEKIKVFFKKVWELFKPQVIKAGALINKAVMTGKEDKMTKAVETISSPQGQKETDALTEDLKGVIAKFSSGNIGNMTPEAEEHLKDEAGEYKDVKDPSEIEQLMKDSYNFIERKNTVSKLFFSIKGYLQEGGTINEMYTAIFEAEEKEKEKEELKEGDDATYTNKKGEKVTKTIIRIEGENAVFKTKDGEEFTKPLSEVEKAEGLAKKIAGGFVNEQGVFGWLVEAVGFVFSPLTKLKEIMFKGGTNGILTVISGIKRGMKNAFKYVVIGVVVGLVYHIVHGLMVLTGEGGGESTEGKPEIESGAASTAPEVKPKFNLKKESIELLLEAEGDVPAVDVKKPTKYTEFLKDAKGIIAPAVGGMVFAALSHFFPVVKYILEAILVTIGLFELVGALCKLEWVKKKNLKVCKVQHSAHHWLESKVEGK